MNTSALDTSLLDRTVAHVRGSAESWSATPLTERITLLERLLPRVVSRAPELAAAGARAKGYAPDSQWTAEDWIGGPWALAQNAAAYLHVLRRIAAGKDPVGAKAVHEEDDRTRVDVFPATGWDTLLLNGFTAQVWMRPGITAEQARSRAAGEYRGRPGRPAVALVLGAGNVAAITALDILHKLFAEGQVVIAKMNPVNDYLRPHFEYIFAEFTERGWVRFVDGGAPEGSYLAAHPDVDAIHVTGSDRTHDAIVWGTDEEAEQRRHDDRPLLDKPFSSELGGVSPCIVVPGRWSDADFRFQAEHVVTSKMNNSGHNCIATQILVLPRDWDGTERLLAEIRRVLRELPPRTDYYPGATGRLASVLAAHPQAETLGEGCRVLVPDITDHDDVLITEEVFGSALGVVRLPGRTPDEFLRHAVDFANDTLPGTLGATLIVHPRTEKTHPDAVRSAITGLRYGTLGVNCWSAVGFLLGFTPWGAHPGHTRQDIGSGIGFVHNAFMLEDIEKTVLRAPFTPAPRGLLTGDLSLSPRPPYFVTNRTALTTVERVTRFTAAPSVTKLPALLACALRG
ncbi:aldehyde dehydrogenase family protein [Streptomyces sp. NRRL S-237]|uniref:aldehyde dehydrogenase family protein n=1 Tax=Streptomyces sp. NRRL S-237 TaxID=1463895 RepID=UPI0004C613C4|nr:aldehyde dehydrogenase family protein [Streptomyces sp. NRRL S-237]